MICYGLLVYGSAAKRFCEKLKQYRGELSEQFFFKTRLETLADAQAGYRIPNVFQLSLTEIIQELFTGFRNVSPLKLIDINLSAHKSLLLRRKVRGLIYIPYSRTAVKRKSLSNTKIE